jgi:cation diffusion facilitator CzcD-associated flavoprotein CzcO
VFESQLQTQLFNTDTSNSNNPIFIYEFTDNRNLLNINWIDKKIYTIVTRAVQNDAKKKNRFHNDEADERKTMQFQEDGVTAHIAF